MFLTRCPRVIPVLWTVINTFVEERTREKFAILKGDELAEFVDEINIPDFLGGQMLVRRCTVTEIDDASSLSLSPPSSFKLRPAAPSLVRSILVTTNRTEPMPTRPYSATMLTLSSQSKREPHMRFASMSLAFTLIHSASSGSRRRHAQGRATLLRFRSAEIRVHVYNLSYRQTQIAGSSNH